MYEFVSEFIPTSHGVEILSREHIQPTLSNLTSWAITVVVFRPVGKIENCYGKICKYAIKSKI